LEKNFEKKDRQKDVSVEHKETFRQLPPECPDPSPLNVERQAVIIDKDGQKSDIDILQGLE